MGPSDKSFPRINFLGLVAAVLTIFSVILPWWGLTLTGFGADVTELWGVWGLSGDPVPVVVSSDFTDTLSSFSPIILVLALITAALSAVGSFIPRHLPIAAGLAMAMGTLLAYAGLVSYAVSRNCQGGSCISQITGSSTIFGFSITWGFQLGFYLFTAATVILLVALVLHRSLTQPRTSSVAP